jgi:NitT/TauT family transport system substrate-binding protein
MSWITRGLAGIALLAFAVSPGAAQNKITIGTVGIGSPLEWPLYIAAKKGFLEQEKIVLDWIGVPASAGVMQQLAAGSLNIGTTGIADALRASDRGAPVRLMRVGMPVSPYEIYAAKGVKSWTDLRKKSVMIGGAKDITRVYFEDMAKPNKLNPGEYDYIYAGSTAARFAALTSGSVAATILFPPFNFAAARQGFTSLGLSADYTKNFPFTAYSVNVNWARTNKDAIKGFLAAYAKGVDWYYDPKNRAEAIPILISYLKSDPKDVAETYDFFAKLRAFSREGAVEGAGIENYLAILKQQGDLEGGADLSRFYDPLLVR